MAEPKTIYVVTPHQHIADGIRTCSSLKEANVVCLPTKNVSAVYPFSLSEEMYVRIPKTFDCLVSTPKILADLIQRGYEIKWAYMYTVGVESLFKEFHEKPKGMVITRLPGTGNGERSAEYVIGQIVAREKFFYTFNNQQKISLWNRTDMVKRNSLRSLTIGILGMGSIGSQVAKACKYFGMSVWGLSRTQKKDTSDSPFDVSKVTADLPEFLSRCDYICNTLPSTTQTRGLLAGDVFKYCSEKSSVFLNIGRGDVTTDKSILNAIEKGWLSGAILDVFEKEPLPAESPLWSNPKVIITPHISGPMDPENVVRVFESNYKKFLQGKQLDCMVDWEKGY